MRCLILRGRALAAGAVVLMAGIASTARGQNLTAALVAGGFDDPVGIYAAPNDPGRIFIAERQGIIKVVRDGVVLDEPFLDISDRVLAKTDGGFMSLAFHPDYANNGYAYVYYTDLEDNAVVMRYDVSANPDVLDPASEFQIIKIIRNAVQHLHPGGLCAFSPTDGYMYISTGDAGPLGDPENHAQDPQLLLGKILRIDVDGGSPYAIPPDNPFVDDPNARDEIWAMGFRNPWRASFDRETGDLYIGDVGDFAWEEVSFIADGDGGRNMGWAIKEGRHCNRPPDNCDPDNLLTDPILEYAHSFNPFRCAVIGGYVYRGRSMPLLRGSYFFGDYCSNEIFSIRYNGNRIVEFVDRSDELRQPGFFPALSSFGQDSNGELYFCELGQGRVFRIEAAMRVDATELIAGEDATLSVTGAAPGNLVAFAYSRAGVGETFVPPLNTTLALERPVLAGYTRADAAGEAAITATIPGRAAGLRVWIQAAQFGNTSNVITAVVR